MKKINVTYNIELDTWEKNIVDLDNDLQSMIEFSIVSSEELAKVSGIKVFLDITDSEGNEVFDLQHPTGVARLEMVSRAPLFSEQFYTKPKCKYNIKFSLTQNLKTFGHEFVLDAGLPLQPFPSWEWSEIDNQWISPKGPCPMGPYDWNEETKEWELMNDTPTANPGPGYQIE